jgi:taurine dioxygenase
MPDRHEDVAMTQELTFTRITGHIGAEVHGADLRKRLDDAQIEQIKDAIYHHHVLFFRDQGINEQQHHDFALRFGELQVETPHDREPEFLRLEDTAEKAPRADRWHADHTCMKSPPGIAFLWAEKVPEYGGDTMWVSLPAIYQSLSPKLRALAEQLSVRHGVRNGYGAGVRRRLTEQGMPKDQVDARIAWMEAEVFAIHPLVRTHRVTGEQSLFLSPNYVECIDGLHPEESQLLLDFFNRKLDDVHFQVRWRWRDRDLAMWDNAATNHRALDDHFHIVPQYRAMRRCVVQGGVPFFKPSTAQPASEVVAA